MLLTIKLQIFSYNTHYHVFEYFTNSISMQGSGKLILVKKI
jgi:hypothetical protein